MDRLQEKYAKEAAPELTKKFGYKNVMQLPKLEKVIINMGVGEAVGNPKALDAANYSVGLKEQLIFPEIDYDKIDKVRGMNVVIVTTAKTDEEARELLSLLGMPFSA